MNNIILSTRNIDDLVNDIASEVISRIMSQQNPSQESGQDELLTKAELLKYLSITSPTLWRWEKQGKIQSYGIGAKRYYKRADLEKFLILKI